MRSPEFLVSDADLVPTAEAAASLPTPERLGILVTMAWHLRQRDTARALVLGDAASEQLGHAGSSSAGLAARLALVAAEARWLAGDLEPASASANRCLAMARTAGDGIAAFDAHWLLAHVAEDRGDSRARDGHFADALGAARSAGDAQRETLGQGALDYWVALSGDHADRDAWERRVAGLVASADPALASWGNDCRALAAFERGDYALAATCLGNAFEDAKVTGQVWRAITIATNAGACFSNLNDFDAALEWTERGLDLARETGWPGRLALCLIQAAHKLRQLRRFEPARAMLEEALERLAPFSRSRNRAIALHYLGELELDLGRDIRTGFILGGDRNRRDDRHRPSLARPNAAWASPGAG